MDIYLFYMCIYSTHYQNEFYEKQLYLCGEDTGLFTLSINF